MTTLSGGTRRRLDLAVSMLAEPTVLFLDEPTTGLDPRSRMALWATVRELRDQDSVLLCGRHLRLMGRRPASLAEVIVLPLAFTLLFFTVFQRTMARAGIDYAQYLILAVIVQAVFFTALSTAVHAAEDAQSGLLQRLRCLPVARIAPSAGLLLAELVSVVISMAVLIPVGMVLGFRFEAGFLAATGFVGVACLFALTLCAGYLALGLAASRPEGANALAVLVYFPLLLLSNAFTTTEAFPTGWSRWYRTSRSPG